jgi:hypothetical protein
MKKKSLQDKKLTAKKLKKLKGGYQDLNPDGPNPGWVFGY